MSANRPAESSSPPSSKRTLSAWFSGRAATFPAATTRDMTDEQLLDLDLDTALSSPGSPSGAGKRQQQQEDCYSPAAYQTLQATAIGLLHKFQTAYRQRTVELREFQVRQTAQRDEVDGLENRNMLLQLQLENVARQAEDQEAAMRQLAEELAREKNLRVEERMAREKAVAPLSRNPSVESMSVISEDLGFDEEETTRRRGWRKSGVTVRSEQSLDTAGDESTDDASIFSRSRSPTLSLSVYEGGLITPERALPLHAMSPNSPSGTLPPSPPPPPSSSSSSLSPLFPSPHSTSQFNPPPRLVPRPAPQMSTFQKLLRGMSGEPTHGEEGGGSGGSGGSDGDQGRTGCRNCQGQDASMAWDTVSLLHDENRGLKVRVEELEKGVDGALSAILGVGL